MVFAACKIISIFPFVGCNYFWYCSCIGNVYTTHLQISSATGRSLVNKKTEKKSAKKNSQLVLRLDKDERDAFIRQFLKDHQAE